MSSVFDFLDDPGGADHPADQDGRQHGDEGHHKAVADVIHEVQKLSDAAGRKLNFYIEKAVAGNKSLFSAMMNIEAYKMGLKDSNFSESTGLHNKINYSTSSVN